MNSYVKTYNILIGTKLFGIKKNLIEDYEL